jgi:hypothetical protein
MAKFTVRVELHGTNGDESYYEVLHEAMLEEGFSHTITDTNTGVHYILPRAEYNIIRDLTREQIMNRTKRAARKTKTKFSILVSPCSGRLWSGLDVFVED